MTKISDLIQGDLNKLIELASQLKETRQKLLEAAVAEESILVHYRETPPVHTKNEFTHECNICGQAWVNRHVMSQCVMCQSDNLSVFRKLPEAA